MWIGMQRTVDKTAPCFNPRNKKERNLRHAQACFVRLYYLTVHITLRVLYTAAVIKYGIAQWLDHGSERKMKQQKRYLKFISLLPARRDGKYAAKRLIEVIMPMAIKRSAHLSFTG